MCSMPNEDRLLRCLTRTVYSGTLDASGYAEFTIQDWDPDDPSNVTFYRRFPADWAHPSTWVKQSGVNGLRISDDGLALIGCSRGADCWPDDYPREYRVVVIK
jgi:hypothetical protein